MYIKNSMLGGLLTLFAFSIQSCQTDFTETGASIPSDEHLDFDRYSISELSTSQTWLEQVNVKDLPIVALGAYNHNVFGSQKRHLVTQIYPKNEDQLSTVGNNPVLDSVYVYIPLNSQKSYTDNSGSGVYNVQNMYGSGSFNLKVYENGYMLTTNNPNDNFENQFYYSNQKELFDNQKIGNPLNNSSNTKQNTNFEFNNEEILLYKYNADGTPQVDKNGAQIIKERKAPGVWLDLNKDYFQQKFFTSEAYKNMINHAVFSQFFRGLYFEVTETNGNALAQFDLAQAELVFVYKQDKANGKGRERKTLTFTMGNKEEAYATSVNLIEEQVSAQFTDGIQDGSQKLWLKGGTVNYATINVFDITTSNGNTISQELQTLKDNHWLINQAVLTIKVDSETMGSTFDLSPSRLYLFDNTNKSVIFDYVKDQTTNPVKNIYNGILNSDKKEYRFRITEYIKQLIDKDSTNFQLGLAVANDINISLFNAKNLNGKSEPMTATMFPFGTVVYGPQYPDNNKRMKLEIYYTKTK